MLYQPSTKLSFDDRTLHEINEACTKIKQTCKEETMLYLPGGQITENDVTSAIWDLKHKKACGEDKIQNEHLYYGGPAVVSCLMILFNTVITKSNVPQQWRKSLVVPIFKGGDKPKNSPDSYRPVCLVSVVLKVFEKLILQRLQSHVLIPGTFPNSFQQEFQKGLSCLTASFSLLETMYHNVELKSKVFVAFLDSRKAFDPVWRKALMHKMLKLGVTGKLWCIVDDFHSKSESAVVVNQCKSKYFSVTEGGQQGGVLSGILYIAFINDLLFEMNKCNIRTGIGNLTCNAPALADDIACIATSPRALQRMLDVCSDYSNKWRFQFNGNKSCVVQFTLNAPKPDFKSSINDEHIPVSDTYIHLDVELNGNFKSLNRTRNVCRKARNTYFAMSNIRTEYTNPLALIKLYKTVVIPSCLYECEVWNNLKNQDSVTKLVNTYLKCVCKF